MDEGKQSHTLRTLKADHSAFVAAGSPRQLLTTMCSSVVIRSRILLVEISHTVVPVLHLHLGIHPWIYAASMLAEVGQLDWHNASRIQRQQQRAVHSIGHTTCQAAAMHSRRGSSLAESPTHFRLAQLLSSARPLAVCHRQHFGGCAGN